MDQKQLEESLHSSIAFALKAARYYKPKTYDRTDADNYYAATADRVMEQLRMSGWKVEAKVLRKDLPENSS